MMESHRPPGWGGRLGGAGYRTGTGRGTAVRQDGMAFPRGQNRCRKEMKTSRTREYADKSDHVDELTAEIDDMSG